METFPLDLEMLCKSPGLKFQFPLYPYTMYYEYYEWRFLLMLINNKLKFVDISFKLII